jgi:hypothetical protein
MTMTTSKVALRKTLLYLSGLLAIAALVFAACDGNDDNGDAGATSTAAAGSPTVPIGTPNATEAATPDEAVTPAFDGNRDPVSGGDDSAVGLLVDVRAGAHDGFDRIVFEFEDALPGYTVEYITGPATQCGSGMDVEVEGGALLSVRISPANAHNEAGEVTVPLLELTPGYSSILEAESTCDFEAVVIWAVGLTEEVDFVVTELSDPPRLVVDVAHP